MSNKKEEVKVEAKFSIVRKIIAAFKLGDAGKLDNFFMRIEKTLSREIESHQKNIDINKFNSKRTIDNLKDDLEDAQQREVEAYMAVTPEDVETNEKASRYVDTYLDGLKRAESDVKRIEDSIKDEEKELKAKNDDLNDQIKNLKKIISSVIG